MASVSPAEPKEILLILDSKQIAARIPADKRFRKSENPAEEMLDRMYRAGQQSFWCRINQILGEKNYRLNYTEDLSDSILEDIQLNKKAILIIDSLPDNDRTRKLCEVAAKSILLVYESPLVDKQVHEKDYQQLFSQIVTYRSDQIEASRVVQYCYPVRREIYSEETWIPFGQRKFCCMIAGFKSSQLPGEAVSVRQRVVEFFRDEHPDQFELFGMGWPKDWQINQGPIDDKDRTMKQFKFVICPENMVGVAGYITEKIWDAFCNGVVPIYMGPPDVEDYIPSNCYINLHHLQKPKKLYKYLSKVTEEEFQEYLKNIRQFLSSNEAKRFSPESFVTIFANALLSTVKST